MTEKCAHLYISGRVQGVFFRAFTQEVARSLGLRGWARNLPDGRVEVQIEGAENVLQLAIDKLKVGPPASSVKNIDINWQNPTGEHREFSIRYH